jgi:hypothetical protein
LAYLDQLGLAVVHARLADRADRNIRDRMAAAEHKRELVRIGDRLRSREHGCEPRHEARTVVAGAVDRLAEFDRILGLEKAAGEIVGAGERNECELLFLPQRQQRILERGVQAPVGVKRHRRIRRA